MAAQTVHFMNGTSKSWAKSLLAKLFKGQSKFSVLPFDSTKQASGDYAGGIAWPDLSFEGADEIFTLKDSFTLSQGDDSTEAINIDQNGGEEIDSEITERGEITFEGNIPAVCAEYCNIFFTKGATVDGSTNPIKGQTGTSYGAQAYDLYSKEVYATILIENAAVDQGLAFARVKLTLSLPNFESGTPAYLKLRGTVYANTDAAGTQGAWAVCKKYVSA